MYSKDSKFEMSVVGVSRQVSLETVRIANIAGDFVSSLVRSRGQGKALKRQLQDGGQSQTQ